ncbi:par-6 family cell polarity regulator gamma a [Denticeps clupeoides]|uniref:par-6 family cell polarity regulator gamma a n=1 Tax=Denticeps clupeoides TaxID=299321 RepID=UPI0010A4E1E2|nr:partitioning defective 6 homolog gamma-like [Denticeps clupeoides]
MIRSFGKSPSSRSCSVVEVKSKHGAEFRRFSVDRVQPGGFEDFYRLILQLHQLSSCKVDVGYADVQGELLPINNDDNFHKAVSSAHPVLRIFIQRQENADHGDTSKGSIILRTDLNRRRPNVRIGTPQDFRPVSSVIDVDILPESHRRVRLYCRGSGKPLGFYIRDGTTMRVTPHGLEKVPVIFISRVVPGGLADSTGLLAINDQVLEVNGIEVAGKSLQQVTDMMIANSHNLIITVKPANQRNNVVRNSGVTGSSEQPVNSRGGKIYPGLPVILGSYSWNGDEFNSDDDVDVVIERAIKDPPRRPACSSSSQRLSRPPSSRSKTRMCFPGPSEQPLSMVTAASYHSQPCLNKPELLRDHHLQKHCTSSTSLHEILHTLRTDFHRSMQLRHGAVEEDGIVITL